MPFLFGFSNIAHRGDNELGKYSEHSYEAYDHAVANGANYLELDLQKTRDRVLVVSHDDNLGRVFGVDKKIDQNKFQDLRQVENRSGEKIHSLQEIFTRYKVDPQIKFMIETKDGQAGMEKELVLLIKKNNLSKRVLFESFSLKSLAKLAKLAPDIPRTQLGGNYHDIGNNQFFADGYYSPVVANFLQKHDKGYIVWGADSKQQMEKLLKANVAGIITDFPGRLNNVTQRENALPVKKINGDVTIMKPFALVKNSWRILPKGSKVNIKYVFDKNGQLNYGLNSHEWLSEQDVRRINKNAPETEQGQVYLGHGAPLWRDPLGNQPLGRDLRAESKWNYYAVSRVNGHKFYNLGGNQWLDGRDVKKVK